MTSNFLGRLAFFAALAIPASAQLTYQINSTPPTALIAGGTIGFPTTVVGSQSSAVIQVTNSGTANATVSTITVSGAGFQVSALTLPVTLTPNANLTFIVTYSPTVAGSANGSLVVNSTTFVITGNSLASGLVYSYVTAGATITLSASNPSVVFSPVAIAQSATVTFDIKNVGGSPVIISNIGIGQAVSPFSVIGLPALPATIAPGADTSFTIAFQPTALGFVNGTLVLDNTSIPLIASGTAPPALPSYTIGGVNGAVPPRTQPKISLTLSQAYPVAIGGTLILTASGSLPNDPAVQFASGGQSVSFVIPANTTNAVFGNFGTSIAFQTGTVASTITFTPSFTTQGGQVDLTPKPPSTLQVTVAPAVPTLIGIQLTTETANGFSIVVTGFATTRTLTNWTVQFGTAPGYSMPTSKFTINLQAASTLWFQSTSSQTFGGQFTITVPFSFGGTVPSNTSILSAISSVAVNVSNELGTSNTVQATLQ